MVTKKYFFIINPNAGKSNGSSEWLKIKSLLEKNSIIFDFKLTENAGHAEIIVKEKIIEGYRNFIIVGGDGTLNEVVNGIFKQKNVATSNINIGLFSLGTGNDWARYFKFSKNYEFAVKRLTENKIVKQDVGKIIYKSDKILNDRYFLNVAGIGLDSIIVYSVNQIKKRGKQTKLAYFIALIKCFLKYKSEKITININDEVLCDNFLSLSIGNGKFSGGGMQQTPDAINNDGLFDVAIYPNMTKLKMILNMYKLYNGKIKKLKGLNYIKTKQLSISIDKNNIFELDGEIISGDNFEISIIENAINVII